MKYLILLMLFPLSVMAQTAPKTKKKMTWEEAEKKCLQIEETRRKKIKTCQQVEVRNKKIEDMADPSYDPLIPKEKKGDKVNAFDLYFGYGIVGNMTGLNAEMEYRFKHFGIGAFYFQNQVDSPEIGGGQLKGSIMGASGRYRFLPLSVTNKGSKADPGLFMNVGVASYDSATEGKLPMYIYLGGGVDIAYPILKLSSGSILSGYGKIGMSYIYHTESMFLYLGTTGSVGLKLEF